VQLLALGILGEYLWRTLDAARSRKGFLVRDRTPEAGGGASGRALGRGHEDQASLVAEPRNRP